MVIKIQWPLLPLYFTKKETLLHKPADEKEVAPMQMVWSTENDSAIDVIVQEEVLKKMIKHRMEFF